MSQQSKTTLQSAINTQIADNTSGDISAADIRDNLINITDSLLFNTGSEQSLTGSLNVTEGITGSLLGTASYATQALSASYAISASYEINYETSSSYANTASYAETATSASYAATASYVLNAVSSSFTTLAQTANTASYIVTAQTASFVATSSWAVSASQAISASWAPSVASNPFPFTGSAIISGSLGVTGSVGIQNGDITVTPSSATTKIAITDGFMKNEMTKTSTVIANQASPYNFSLGSYIYDPVGSPFFPLSNAIYSGGTTDLLISSQQKLNLEATSVEITGSLVTSGSIMGVALTSSTSGTAGINYQSDLTTVIPSLQLASSTNTYNLRIFSPTLQQNYISSSHQLYLHSQGNLGIKAGNSANGNVTIATGTSSGTITMTAFSNMTFTASAATYNTSTFTINAPTTRITSSLGVTGSINLTGSISSISSSTSLTPGQGAVNLQSSVTNRIPSLILASSDNSNTVKIGSYTDSFHYITSSNNLEITAPSLSLQSDLHEVYGNMLLYNNITITGTTNINGLMTLEPTDPLPSATNGSIAYSSSGDFYFASGSAWRKLTL